MSRIRMFPLWLKYSLSSILVFSLLFLGTITISTNRMIESQIEDLIETWWFLSGAVSSDIAEELKATEGMVSFLAQPQVLSQVFQNNDYSLLESYRSEMIGKCDSLFLMDFENDKYLSFKDKYKLFNGSQSFTREVTDQYLFRSLESARNGRSYISPSYFDPVTLEPLLIITYPIFEDGAVKGAITLRYKLVYLWNKVDDLSIEEGVHAMVLNQDRQVIAHTDHNQVSKFWQNEVADFSFDEYRGFQEVTIRDEVYLCVYSPITFRSAHSLVILHERSLALRDIEAMIYFNILIGAGAVLVILFFSFLLGRLLSRPVYPIVEGIQQLAKTVHIQPLKVKSKDEFGLIARNFNSMVQELKEKESIKRTFGQYISSDIRDEILKGTISTEGEEKECTILFSDIRGFTTLSEKFPAKTILEILNQYFAEMIKVVDRNHGTVNKFMGDALMVLYGIPLKKGNHAEQAVRSALEMIKALEQLNNSFRVSYGIELKIGIGIATGKVIAGNIGVIQRKEYSVIGDIVNVASRLEKATKKMQKSLIFTDETAKLLPADFPTQVLGRFTVRGKDKPLVLHTVRLEVFNRFGIQKEQQTVTL